MRPRLLTPRNFVLFIAAVAIFTGMAFWLKSGMPLPWGKVPSTAGKIAFVSDRDGHPDLWMMNAADGSEAAAITNDAPDDRTPVWAPKGDQVAFISANRNGVNPQVFNADPVPGAAVTPVTRTDSAKDAPAYGADGRLYYLDAGKIVVVSADGKDTDALLPNHEQRQYEQQQQAANKGSLFEAGGFRQVVPSPDNHHLVAVMHTDHGDALMLYDAAEDKQALFLLGIADQVHVAYLADGRLVAAFDGSGPAKQPFPLASKEIQSAKLSPQDQDALDRIRNLIINPSEAGGMSLPHDESLHLIVLMDADGVPQGAFPLQGFVTDSLSVAPDGNQVVLASERSKSSGMLLADLTQQAVRPLSTQPARDCTWSPDSKQVAFTSGKDVFMTSVEGDAKPVNLTGGKGQNYSPIWSPAVPKK